MPTKKRLRLQSGEFKRTDEDAEPLTTDYCMERATVCLEEAARSQAPLNTEFTRQAEVWFSLAEALRPKSA